MNVPGRPRPVAQPKARSLIGPSRNLIGPSARLAETTGQRLRPVAQLKTKVPQLVRLGRAPGKVHAHSGAVSAPRTGRLPLLGTLTSRKPAPAGMRLLRAQQPHVKQTPLATSAAMSVAPAADASADRAAKTPGMRFVNKLPQDVGKTKGLKRAQPLAQPKMAKKPRGSVKTFRVVWAEGLAIRVGPGCGEKKTGEDLFGTFVVSRIV